MFVGFFIYYFFEMYFFLLGRIEHRSEIVDVILPKEILLPTVLENILSSIVLEWDVILEGAVK